MNFYKQITIMTFLIAAPLIALSTGAESMSKSIRKVAPRGISESFYLCLDKAGDSSVDDAACIVNEKSNQDARLNKAYKNLLTILKGDAKSELIDSEKSWIISRTKDNSFEGQLYSGGSQIGNLEREQNDTFRLCERANVIEKYLAIASLTL